MSSSPDPGPGTAPRRQELDRFLASCELADASVEPLAEDASFRRYLRIDAAASSYVVMDAPPPLENVRSFVRIDEHLRDLGLKAPAIIASDPERGFLLLEDLGDRTFTRVLDDGGPESELYRRAVDTLITLHDHPRATAVDAPAYDLQTLLTEVSLLPDWYYPRLAGHAVPKASRTGYLEIWTRVLTALPEPASTLVLRDFHVDNLMLTHGRNADECGILDFQDAVIGPAAYDLASLLQDARRDIDPDLESEHLEYYLSRRPLLDRDNFLAWYHVLAAQRHAKVLGIFCRLCARDGKCAYLRHLPRVARLLDRACDTLPQLAPVREWMDRHLADRHAIPAIEINGATS